MKKNKNIPVYLKWINRYLCTIGLITMGILLLIYTFNYVNNFKDGNDMTKILPALMSVNTILFGGVVSGLTWQGVKNHSDFKNDVESFRD